MKNSKLTLTDKIWAWAGRFDGVKATTVLQTTHLVKLRLHEEDISIEAASISLHIS